MTTLLPVPNREAVLACLDEAKARGTLVGEPHITDSSLCWVTYRADQYGTKFCVCYDPDDAD